MEKKEKKRVHLFKRRTYITDWSEKIMEAIRTGSITKELVYNSALGLYEVGVSDGYELRIEDNKYFKDKQNERRTISWNGIQDHLDDLLSKETPVETKIVDDAKV